MKDKVQVYLAGDMLTKGSILLREQEKKQMQEAGLSVYSPIDDKEINDKSNQTKESNDNLAERIVSKDTKAIIESDVIVIEPQPFALGTHVELGQIKGMKDMGKLVQKLVQDSSLSAQESLDKIGALVEEMIQKPVHAHFNDIRRTNIPEQGDRRSWGVNQYVYGTVLDLTDGEGFEEFDEIIQKICDYQSGKKVR